MSQHEKQTRLRNNLALAGRSAQLICDIVLINSIQNCKAGAFPPCL
jgi:hypothetical protein